MRTRGLIVLADGVQAAFAAGAAAELARRGVSWSVGRGAGLGAQVAVLALLGEAEDAARRWSRQSDSGCPLLVPMVAAIRERMGDSAVTIQPDAWRLPGWLDEGALAEHLRPEAAALPARLQRVGKRMGVAVCDLASGVVSWRDITHLDAPGAADSLAAAARFAGGWGPTAGTEASLLWGGVGAIPADGLPSEMEWDVVCGFPVPPVPRPGVGTVVWETIQRRDEVVAGRLVAGWGAEPGVRVIAPTQEDLRQAAARPDAELGVEYPLPWERNGELCALLVRMGADAARRIMGGQVS